MERKNRNRLIAAICVLLILVMVSAALYALRSSIRTYGEEVDETKSALHGIDLSAHNGKVDFRKVRDSGIDFVIIKASEGAEFRDSSFAVNYSGAIENEIYVGAYHFFRFDVDGVLQAYNFMDAVDGKEMSLPLVIDVEEHGNPYVFIKSRVVRQLQDMVDVLVSNEYKVMIYTNKDGYEKFIKGNFDDYPLWICSFDTPSDIEWTIWQYSHWGEVDGIDGDVDMNMFYGNELQWKEWIR